MLPRRFALVRHVDYTGVAGVGVIAFGIAFSDGHIVLRWCSAHPATSSWDSFDDLLAVHGHDEGTSIQWIDAPTSELAGFPPAAGTGRRARRRAAMTDRASAPTPATMAADPSANGSVGPATEIALPPPQQPGRHRRASQLEQPV
jgi:hypothetical protein